MVLTQSDPWRILYIEDDQDDYILAREMLAQSRGRIFQLEWAATYDEGCEKLEGSRYDAVLVDYDLGAKTGIDLIRECSGKTCSPFILYTGRGSYDLDVEAMRAGATLYLSKADANPLLLERTIRYAIERKQVEQELYQSRQRTQEILESITDGFFELDRSWRFTYINHRAAENVGRKPEELIGQSIWDSFPGILGANQEPLYRMVMEQRQPVHVELHGMIANRWYEYRMYPSTAGITVYWTDITERKQAEATLRASDARERTRSIELQAIIDSVPAFMWITHDRQGKDMIGNLAAYSLVDVDPGENLSKSGADPEKVRGFRPLRDGQEIPPEELPVQQVAQTGIPLRDYEFDIEVGGKIRHLLGNVSPLLDENGLPAGAVSAFIDITERTEINARLQESERRFRVALASAPITVFTTGRDLRITWMYDPQPGFQLDQVLGLRLDELNPNEYGKELVALQQEVIDTGQPRQGEIETVAYGKLAYFAYTIDLVRDAAGKVTGLACAGYDITARKQTEKDLQHYVEELERSNQALQDFSFIASHDLQEPLRKVQAFGHMLSSRFGEDLGVEGKDYITRISSAANRMSSMLNGLLDYSRITTQGQPFVEVDLKALASEVLSDLDARILQTGGKVELGDLPAIKADPIQIRQLLQNLIGNALKYHRPGVPPLVTVTARRARGKLVIAVQDNGIGFEEQYAARIFEPFTRLSGKAGIDGAGMGLAICKKIVERHGGALDADSTPGQGSTFTITLPGS